MRPDPARTSRAASAAAKRSGRCRSYHGPVVAADRVVVGDRATGGDHRLRRRRLDLVPLLELRPSAGRREDRVVGRRAVRVHVREAPADPPVAADRVAPRPSVAAFTDSVELVEAVPGDRGLERLARSRRRRRAGRARKARAGSRRASSRSLDRRSCRRSGSRCRPSPPWSAQHSQRELHPVVDGMVRGLETEHQHARPPSLPAAPYRRGAAPGSSSRQFVG